MPEEKPTVYILRGNDHEAIKSTIKQFYESLGEPDMAEMNTNRLEGKSTSLNDLRAAALALPFLTDRRLVVLEDAIHPYGGKENEHKRDEFLALLDSLPASTALVLEVPDSQKYKKNNQGQWELVWEKLKEQHWLIKWAKDAGHRAFIVDCALPQEDKMLTWIQRKVGELGGSITPQGAATLAEYVGTNTQRATQEINKLLTYVNFERAVEDEDVRNLTMEDRQVNIFDMVDAIGSRDGQKALDLLCLLKDEVDFGQLFGMVIRQFRMLLQAREVMDAGGNVRETARIIGQPYFVADKITKQVRSFDLPSLEGIYHRLHEIDVNAKTGQMDGYVALDVLITRLANNLVLTP